MMDEGTEYHSQDVLQKNLLITPQAEYFALSKQLKHPRLSSMEITLFQLHDARTAAHILEVLVREADEQDRKAYDLMRPFYDKICERYGLQNALKDEDRKMRKRETTVRAPAPSPSAAEGQAAGEPSEQHDTTQAS